MTAENTLSLRRRARALFEAGLAAADPGSAVLGSLESAPIAIGGKLWIIALGKAAVPMIKAARVVLPSWAEALVITNPENATEVEGATLFAASHPVPDAVGIEAGRAVMALLEKTGPGDHVVVLVSGGGSALLPAPLPGLTLEDKIALNAALLASGADITQMNMIRQQVSRLKGGGLAQLAAPATVTALILSDVVGDDLSVIASGPTAPPIGTPAQAREALEALGLAETLPPAIPAALQEAVKEAGSFSHVDNRLIGSNAASLAAMQAAAPEAIVQRVPLDGDVEDAARHLIETARVPGTYLFGGETTVQLRGTGRGGRNQHLALRLADLASQAGWGKGWCFLSGGTDGRDGPTDAAGGLVDGGTLARCRAAGLDPLAALENNDSYTALKAADDLLITGATGTNVADLQILIRT